MKPIVSIFVSLLLLFNIGLADNEPAISIPNANNLFEGQDTTFIEIIDSSLGEGLNAVLLLLYKIGYGIAVIITVLLAIKLILTSPAKKAEVKAAIMPYLLGLLLLVAGVPIATKVIELFTNFL